LTFDLWAIARSYRETAELTTSRARMSAFDYGIMFVDASGKSWHRHAAGTLHRNPWLEYLSDGSRSPNVPPVFSTEKYVPLTAPGYTVPQARQPFVKTGPKSAEGCDTGAP
jgi:hypothetical protein